MEYEPLPDHEDHWVPKGQESQHCGFDFCECKPSLRLYFGRWVWMHNLDDEANLLEQAEAIRTITSIQLWSAVIGQQVPHQIMPFPEGTNQVMWPTPSRKQ